MGWNGNNVFNGSHQYTGKSASTEIVVYDIFHIIQKGSWPKFNTFNLKFLEQKYRL